MVLSERLLAKYLVDLALNCLDKCRYPMGTNWAPLFADFFFRYERDFMLSPSDNNQADVVHFKISRYLLIMDTPYLNKR